MLTEQLSEDLKAALKSGSAKTSSTLRLVLAQIHNKEIEKRGRTSGGTAGTERLNDAETMEVLQKEAKKRRESIELFLQGGRMDLAQGEREELEIISAYLPQRMNREEVAAVITKLIADGTLDFNTLIRDAMKTLKGKADGALVSAIIKEKLGQ